MKLTTADTASTAMFIGDGAYSPAGNRWKNNRLRGFAVCAVLAVVKAGADDEGWGRRMDVNV